jgi:hypothetical protein
LIKGEADLQGAGLRLSPLPDLSCLVRPRGLRTGCARAQAQRQYCRRKRARDAEALSAGRLRALGVEEVDLADGGVDGALATCSTNAASGINGVDRAASFGRRRVAFACLRHSRRRSSSHSLRTTSERLAAHAEAVARERRLGAPVVVPGRIRPDFSGAPALRLARNAHADGLDPPSTRARVGRDHHRRAPSAAAVCSRIVATIISQSSR